LVVLSIALSSAQAQTTRAASPADAVVLVIANAPSGKELGQAFFIGDGSLAVAPRHVLYMQTNEAPSESLALLTLLSPYFGDCAEARLVAEDVDEDLAIIRCEWKQHPALAL